MLNYKIEVVEAERAGLLPLLLRAILEKASRDHRRLSHLKKARGIYRLRVSDMQCFLELSTEGAKIYSDGERRWDASIRGPMEDFIKAAMGRIPIPSLLSGKLQIRGNYFKMARFFLAIRK